MRKSIAAVLITSLLSCGAQEDDVATKSSNLMTPSFRQLAYACPQTPQSTVAVSFVSSPIAGNLIVVFVGWSSGTQTVSSISDNRGNSYVFAVGPTRIGTFESQSVYYASNVAAGPTTVTAQMSGSVPYVDLRIVEYNGVDPANPLDVAVGANGTGTNSSSGPLTTHAPNALIVAGNKVKNYTTGPGPSYTSRVVTVPDGDIIEDRIVAAAGTYTATAPLGDGSAAWVMNAVAFRAAPDLPDGGAGASGTGGATGGAGGGGGMSGAGGIGGSGGAAGTGGDAGAGGMSGVGGMGGSGGAAGTGGDAGVGGMGGSGGAAGAGGVAGAAGDGGVSGSEGTAGASGTGGSIGTGGAPPPPPPPPVFPVVYSSDHRHLQDSNGVPFPIFGRTAWGIVTIPAVDARSFLDDCVTKGFNTIEIGMIHHNPATLNAPIAGNNTLPFLKRLDGADWSGSTTYGNVNTEAPDFTTPNPAYWAFIDGLMNDALARGILVMGFPAYVGFSGGLQGWMVEMVANGANRMMTYGMFVANRYKNQPNIVWMAGGDAGTGSHPFTAPQVTVEHAFLVGMHAVPGQQSVLFSAEWDTESISPDQVQFGTSMTLNGAYSWSGDVNTQGRRAYSFTPAYPSFLLEEPYDEEGPDGNSKNPSATQPVRRFEWWGVLTTIGGYVAGNAYVWPFNTNWTSHMNTQGAQDLTRLNTFVRSLPWWQLVPSGLNGMQTLCTAGCGSGASVVTAAATPSGTTLVAYVPPAHSGSVTIAMTAMAGSSTARWFNPATAAYTTIGTFPNTGTQSFNPPADNGSGFDDWVLVLQ